MNEDRYGRVVEVFHGAADLQGPDREAYLARACGDDVALRRDVEALLAQDERPDERIRDDGLGLGRELRATALEKAKPREVASVEALPERVGHYRILDRLGEGGMGTVLLAEQNHPRRLVALKMVRPGMISASLRRRFRFEVEALGRLRHPGIAEIYEAGEFETEVGPQPFFAMEYVEGVPLLQYARTRGLDVRARLELLARIADAVHHAHLHGILHRDLKPDNVLVVEGVGATFPGSPAELAALGQPKVLDFGVARATESDTQVTTILTDAVQIVGTISYMSPEQAQGDSAGLDARSDIYALGVLLYELLAGRPPFDVRDKPIPEALRILQEEEPTRLGSIRTVFRGDIETIVGKALEKERERRYASAAELAADIRRYLTGEPIAAHPPSTLYQLGKFARRHRQLVGGVLLLFAVLVAGIVSSLSFAVRAGRGETAALRNEYRMSLMTADAVGDDDPARARLHLDGVPEQLRGWEWRHLSARFTPVFSEHLGDLRGLGVAGSTGVRRGARVTARQPDGTLLAALVREAGVELIEPRSGAVLETFGGERSGWIPFLSPDGSRLAAFDPFREELIVWETHPKKRSCVVPLPGVEACHVGFSPDGSLLVISTVDGAALHESATGRCLLRTAPRPSRATLAVFSPDGRTFAVQAQAWGSEALGGDDLFLCVYDLAGECLARRLMRSGCHALEFSPDGSNLVVGQQQRSIRILDARTLEDEGTLYGHTDAVTALAFSPDRSRLASGAADLKLRVWDFEHGDALRSLSALRAGHAPTSLTFSADGARVAAGSLLGVRVLELEHVARRVLRGHGGFVYRVAFSPDGALLASSGWDETVRLWDPLTGRQLIALPSDGRAPFILGFLPDGDHLYGGRLWDTATGDPILSPRSRKDRFLFDLLAEPDPEGKGYDPSYRSFAGGTKRVSSAGEQIALSWDRRLAAIGHPAGGVLLQDRASGRILRQIGDPDLVTVAVAFSPDGSRIVTGHVDGTVRVWDVARDRCVAILRGHTGVVYSIDFSPDASRIASGANDCNIVLWDAARLEEVAVLRGHTSYVHSVCFSPDGTLLASGSGDGTVRLWDSASPIERRRQVDGQKELQLAMSPYVNELLAQLPSTLDVADRLRSDDSLDPGRRRAALRVLLERCVALRAGRTD